MSDTVQNGKGDRARNNYSEQFRRNYDLIFGAARNGGALKGGGAHRGGPNAASAASETKGDPPKESFSE